MYDVIAIGNALVDHEYVLSDAALEETELTKGNMTLAAFEEQHDKRRANRPPKMRSPSSSLNYDG